MSTTKITLGVAGAIAVAATTITFFQQQTVSKLRDENTALREEEGTLAALRAENQRLQAEKKSALDQSQAEHAELLQLREGLAAWKASAANGPAVNRPPAAAGGNPSASENSRLAPGLIPVGLLANVGRATPNAAAQTIMWAAQHGEIDVAASGLTFDPAERAKMEAFINTLPEKLRTEYGTPERMMAFVIAGSPNPVAGVQLLKETQPDPDTVLHQVQVQYQSGALRQDEIKFHRTADGWQQVVSASTVDRVIAYFKGRQ